MVFVTARDHPTIFLMLSEKDIQTMREGRTVFVDERVTKDSSFKAVIVSVSPTDEHSLQLIRSSGNLTPGLSNMQPKEDEVTCSDCKGIMFAHSLFEGKCMICWATLAKHLLAMTG